MNFVTSKILDRFRSSQDAEMDRDQEDVLEGSDLDAEGSEVDEEYEKQFANGFVPTLRKATEEAEAEEDGIGDADDGDAAEESSAESDNETSTSTASEAGNEWEADTDAAEEADDSKTIEEHRCVFCGEDEEHDPSEEFEEYLECSVCGDNAHRQCARSAGTLSRDEDAPRWRCKTCVDNGAEADEKVHEDGGLNRLPSASQVAAELLPGHRNSKPDSHSVFNTLILTDDPMDGSRSLRKRKASDIEQNQRPVRKRRRPSDMVSASAGANRSSSAQAESEFEVFDEDDDITMHDREDASDQGGTQRGRARPRRSRKIDKPLVNVVSAEGISLILSFNLDHVRMQKILSSKSKRKRASGSHKKKIPVAVPVDPEPDHYPAIQSGYSAQFYSPVDRDNEDSKSKPYGGILSEDDADTSKTFPMAADRERFETARQKAEEDWQAKMAKTNNLPEPTRISQKLAGPPSKIKCINFGGYEIDTWGTAPYPEEYSRNKILYICEFCLKYMNSDYVAWRHKLKCPQKHPPGDEIYRDGKWSYFEVDGRKNPVYCQNLCLMAKLFLSSKTLYYDVEPFLFYVMTENDELGCHFVGYFSKEKRPTSMNNVSCILVLPLHQRKGYGQMLIEFSYLLTKVEEKTGSPEKPLSDMGLLSYRGYWRLVMCYQLINQTGKISIAQISENTGMTPDDIISALEGLRALVRDPVTKTYALRLDTAYFKEYIANHERKNQPEINPEALVWTPYVMNGGLSLHYEGGGPLHTVAQRDEEQDAVNGSEPPVLDQIQPLDISQQAEENAEVEMEEELASKDMVVAASTDGTTAAASPADPLDSNPSTPVPNDNTRPHSGWSQSTPFSNDFIPPARFEVFPPVPGISAKRRPGRPFGSRRRTVTSRPSSNTMRTNGVSLANGSPAGRRTRSALVPEDGLVNGFGERHDDDATPPAENHESHGLGIRDASGMEDRTLEDEEADVEGEEDI